MKRPNRFPMLLAFALVVLLTLALAARLHAENTGDQKKDEPLGATGPAQSGFKGFKVQKLPTKPTDTPAIEDPEFVTARQLFWSGSYDQAEQRFLSYLGKNPDHEPTKVFLQMIHEARHFDPEKQKLVRKALEEVRFKSIDWKDMPLEAAIKFLRDETRRQIPEGEVVNFVNLVPASADLKKITLNAEDATLDDLIKRISEQAGVFHHVDSDGVVFELKARS